MTISKKIDHDTYQITTRSSVKIVYKGEIIIMDTPKRTTFYLIRRTSAIMRRFNRFCVGANKPICFYKRENMGSKWFMSNSSTGHGCETEIPKNVDRVVVDK